MSESDPEQKADVRPEQRNEIESEKPSSSNFWRIFQSTMAAAFGVQSNKNRKKDFENGNIWVFVAAGIIFTLIFILTITTLVRIALSAA
jgi:hypothetical protein